MKIKRLVLHNFKSYRDAVIKDIDGHSNIVIGKNGHGKSNVHIGRNPLPSFTIPFFG